MTSSRPLRVFFCLASVLVLSCSADQPPAETDGFQPSRLIADGMVIQRDLPVPLWGWADPGTDVEVQFDEQSFSGRADAEGRWQVTLPARPAGGPHLLRIRAEDFQREIHDVMVGDVWLCSGQSNMEWPVAQARDAEAEIAVATDRSIRHFAVPRSSSLKPEDRLVGGEWTVASPETVGGWTAVGYFFARELRKEVDVPIGLIHSSWGGSRIEPWMSATALGFRDDEQAAREVARQLEDEESQLLAKIREQLGELPEHDLGMSGSKAVWADPDLDDGNWDEMELPGRWEGAGWTGLDGVVWFRYRFALSADELKALRANGKPARVGLGMIDDTDTAWLNGRQIGGLERSYDVPRVYPIPIEDLREGDNVIAVRVTDTGLGGGIYGPPEMLFLELDGHRRSLASEWRFRIGSFSYDPSTNANQFPTLLYNQMIHPILDYPVRGVLWYQGESNAGPEDAYPYRLRFPGLIQDWRRRYGLDDLPFLFVQLANFMKPAEQPGESDWAVLRESQSQTLELPQTAQAVIIDIGDADDVHPRNKQDVGLRLSLAARHLVYGEESLVWSGPTYREHRIEQDRVVLTFDHVGGGLLAKDGELEQFAIAGADRRFVWAKAWIEGDRVIVRSEAVPEPIAVRYAWSNNPEGANLYNVEGLPASPFRTDSFPTAAALPERP